MFAYASSDIVIPSLTFTKAELVYAVAVLMADLSPLDNSTKIEMVEVRHYLNQIKGKVAQALSDGTIGRAMANPDALPDKDTVPKPQGPRMPSMDELRRRFPNLSEEEIKEVLEKAKAEQEKKAMEEQKTRPTSPPSFIAKPHVVTEAEMLAATAPPLTEKQKQDRENSRKFASMLGSI